MIYQLIGEHALIRERATTGVGSILTISVKGDFTLHLGGYVYRKQNGAYRIPTSRLEKVNFPLLKEKGKIIRLEGFSYREGCVTPVGEDCADMLLVLFDKLEAQKDRIDALSAALDTHRTSEHAPTLF